jgi:predicted metal-binding protein
MNGRMLRELQEPKKVRRIPAQRDPKEVKKDLETLRKRAIELGASDAAVISASDVVFSNALRKRVAADKKIPSIHWPPDYPKDDLEAAIKAYQNGIFFRVKGDANMPDYGGGQVSDPTHRETMQRVYEISTVLESESFYMGYHLGVAFATGNCRAIFCAQEPSCWATVKGRKCVQPYKGRPSMEAAGMDSLAMARAKKWRLPKREGAPLLSGLVMVV